MQAVFQEWFIPIYFEEESRNLMFSSYRYLSVVYNMIITKILFKEIMTLYSHVFCKEKWTVSWVSFSLFQSIYAGLGCSYWIWISLVRNEYFLDWCCIAQDYHNELLWDDHFGPEQWMNYQAKRLVVWMLKFIECCS